MGVAESGALVLPMSKRMPRSFFILAPLHLVFIKRVNLLPTMEALFEELSELEFEECVLESGPSRTADIEQTLTLGAHGPRGVVVFLI